jgi:hypothetical protein
MKVIFDKNFDFNEKLPKINSKFKKNIKLKYKYPSLYKSGFSSPVNKTNLISYKYPILEDKNYLDKKNLKLNLTVKDLIIDKTLINVPKYKHPLPTFKIENKINLTENKKEKKMKTFKENKIYFLNHKNETNEEFFKIVRNNINEPMNFYIRNFNYTKSNNDDINDNLNVNEKIFLTNEPKKNEDLNDELIKQKNKNINYHSFIGSHKKFIGREKLIRKNDIKNDLSQISNLSYFHDENIKKNMKEFNQKLKNLLK